MTDSERITALEVEMKHVNEKLDTALATLETMNNILQQAKGAKWAVWTLLLSAGAVVGWIGDKLHKLVPILNSGPR